jgi:putative ABC transport system permease protein
MPDWAPHVRARLVSLRLSPTRETEIVDELSQHLDDRYQELIAGGASPDEATRLALADFQSGNVLAQRMASLRQAQQPTAPTTLGASTGHVFNDLWADVRYAGRVLRRSPGFTAAAVLTLALGIGGTTTIFSFVNAVLLRPLPFTDSARLLVVEPDERFSTVTPADFLEWRLRNRAFDTMTAFSIATFSLKGGGEPEQIQAATVSAAFFDTLRVTPILGRAFLSSEDQPGANQVVVIGASLWRRRFQGDPAIVGKVITLDSQSATVVGVAPVGFDFPRDIAPSAMDRARPVELWTPIVLQPGDRANAFLRVVARLRPDVTPGHAQAEIDVIAAQVAEQVPPDRRVRVRLVALHERVVRDVRPLLLVFFGAVALLLIIACANVANLLVARGAVRQTEVVLRVALGATRARLVRQFLTESVVLALLGGLAGVVLAVEGVTVLRALIPPGSLPRLGEIVIDRPTLAFAMLTSLLTGLVFGLIPALRSSKSDVSATIRETGATQTVRSRFLHLLVAGEVALTFVLLVGAGLLINSFWRLTSVDPGFEPERIVTASVTLPEADYPTSAAMTMFSSDVLARLQAAPGVGSAAAINWLPLGGALIRGTFRVEGLSEIPRPASMASKPAVSPGYFLTMGIPLVRGRDFDTRDGEQAARVAIVSDRLARLLWPGVDPIGKRLTLGFGPLDEQPWVIVVGVVGDVKQTTLGDETPPAIYVPLQQAPRPFLLRNLTFVVRTSGDPTGVVPMVRREIRNVDPNLPFDRVQTMRRLLGDSVSEPRFRSTVIGLFATTALVLVATGILGVLAYSVARRTREIGLRMALGAQRTGVLRLVVGQALRMTVTGIAVGLAAALALTRLLSRFLFDVRPSDPATFIAAAVVLIGAAIVASYVPARRATRVDPLVALRAE